MPKKKENQDSEQSFKRAAYRFSPQGVPSQGTNKAQVYADQLSETVVRVASTNFTSDTISGASSQSSRVPIMYVDPMFDPVLLMFPKENLRELNRRLRHYYSFHPIIRNLVNLHSTFPFGDMEVRCSDKEYEPYWQVLAEKLNLMQMVVHMSRDYELLGESFHVGNWSDEDLEWDSFHQYPPENVEVNTTYVGSGIAYSLRPDAELKKKLNSSNPIDRQIFEMLPDDIKENILSGKPILLDNSRVIHYANKPSGYLTRGESPMKAALKYLLAEDKLYMLFLTFIDRHMFPLKIWKVGSKEKHWMPPKKHLDMLKQKLIEAKGDPDYDLIFHAFLEVEYKTGATQHEDLIKWFDWTQKRILIALFANEAMFSEANPYAKDAMSIKLIMHRYMLQRSLINNIITQKVWLPVAKKRDFKILTNAEEKSYVKKYNLPDIKKYILPKMFWRPSNLVNQVQEREYLLKMREKGDLPLEVIYDLLGLDVDKMKNSLKSEEGTYFDPLFRKAKEDILKDPKARNEFVKGKKFNELTLPSGQPLPQAGRPPKPEEEKAKKPTAIIPNSVMPPREKQQEKGILPTPKLEEQPPEL